MKSDILLFKKEKIFHIEYDNQCFLNMMSLHLDLTGTWLSFIKSIYRWNNTNEPKQLEFNENNGKITN